jgi:hypothetical protein
LDREAGRMILTAETKETRWVVAGGKFGEMAHRRRCGNSSVPESLAPFIRNQ